MPLEHHKLRWNLSCSDIFLRKHFSGCSLLLDRKPRSFLCFVLIYLLEPKSRLSLKKIRFKLILMGGSPYVSFFIFLLKRHTHTHILFANQISTQTFPSFFRLLSCLLFSHPLSGHFCERGSRTLISSVSNFRVDLTSYLFVCRLFFLLETWHLCVSISHYYYLYNLSIHLCLFTFFSLSYNFSLLFVFPAHIKGIFLLLRCIYLWKFV